MGEAREMGYPLDDSQSSVVCGAVEARWTGWHRGARASRFALLLAIALMACSTTSYRARFVKPASPQKVDEKAQFLKCHMYDGGVYVLEQWHFDAAGQFLFGNGRAYDPDRKPISTGAQKVRVADIELLETDDPERVPQNGVAVMAVVTGASLAMTALCLANPKACFGSCPTFYTDDGHGRSIQAEGFSSSVARSLETTDVDALWMAHPAGSTFDVLMTNEALETHMVDSVRLMAFERPPGGRVLRAGDDFYAARAIHAPIACSSSQGDCLPDVSVVDDRAYLSPADPHDLSTKEAIDLKFERAQGPIGLVIAARNSLLNTFLFYQALAYMGRNAGDWYMRLNHAPEGELKTLGTFGDLLGDIEVSVRGSDGEYRHVGSYSEVGPIAREVQLIRIPPDASTASDTAPLEVRLTLTAGNWKLDHVGLAELGSRVSPRVIAPSAVLHKDVVDPRALQRLLTPGEHLATYPGDEYTLRFQLPDAHDELYLESRGYYYEWIRNSWLPEQSSWELARLFLDPRGAMQRLAPAYKRIESNMERVFWQSRVGHR